MAREQKEDSLLILSFHCLLSFAKHAGDFRDICAFIPRVIIRHLLCTRYYIRLWIYNVE